MSMFLLPTRIFHGHCHSKVRSHLIRSLETYDHNGNRIAKLRVLVFNNTEREVEERNSFISRVEDAEGIASDMEWKGIQHAIANIFTGRLEGMETLFDYPKAMMGRYHWNARGMQ